MNNIFLKSVKWVGKILVLIILAYLSFGLFFVNDSSQLAVGCFIAIFITIPTIFMFFLKDKFLEKYPNFAKTWKIIYVIYIVIAILFVSAFISGLYVRMQNDKLTKTIDFINSKKMVINWGI